MKIIIEKDHYSLSKVLAWEIVQYINRNPGSLICLAAGETPLATFAELIDLQKRGAVNLADVDYVGLDEWQGVGYETCGSCARTMRDALYSPAGIPESNLLLWDGLKDAHSQRSDIEKWIKSHGGIGLALLGIGMNGHIGFNEQGTDPEALTSVVTLDEITVRVGKKYFSDADVPTVGMTVGIKALSESKCIFLAASGESKASVVRGALWGPATNTLPVSLIMGRPSLCLYIDKPLWDVLG